MIAAGVDDTNIIFHHSSVIPSTSNIPFTSSNIKRDWPLFFQEARVVFISTVLSSCESLPQVALARPADRQDYLDWFKTESSFDKLSSVIAEGGSTSWGAGPWTPASAAGRLRFFRSLAIL